MEPLFPSEWFVAGVVTADSAADFARYAAVRPDRSQRYWKWSAFRDWAEERERLTEGECRSAYALGEAEADRNLGTAMMCHVLYRRECPPELREWARKSERAAVRRTAR